MQKYFGKSSAEVAGDSGSRQLQNVECSWQMPGFLLVPNCEIYFSIASRIFGALGSLFKRPIQCGCDIGQIVTFENNTDSQYVLTHSDLIVSSQIVRERNV